MDLTMLSRTYNKKPIEKSPFKREVRRYWNSISRTDFEPRENFCERCGRGIGKDFIYHELINFKGHLICFNCYEDKLKGIRLPIDIEDYTKDTKRPLGYIPVANR